MFNKEFLKTLTVLYAEDDASIRTSLSNILKKVFKEVVICEDGQEGIDNYKNYSQSIEFDAIISDINMPNKNGLEMVKEIRELNSEIPVIMTTAHGEANYLMEAIKVNVSGYSLKPIDTKELLQTVQKFCEVKRNQRLIVQKEAELSEYMDLINTLATITKVDMTETITESNDFFNEISEYTSEELFEKPITELLHKDCLAGSYQEMKASIKRGNTWKGKLKLLNKDGEIFYLRTTSIPQKDTHSSVIIGYISIGFLADEEEAERALTMQQVRHNMLKEKQKVLQLTKKVKELQKSIGAPASSECLKNERLLKINLKEEKSKTLSLVKQVKYYEEQLHELESKLSNIVSVEASKRQIVVDKVKELQKENAKLKENLITAQNQVKALQPKPKYVE
jgi:PAS domain S-box-containing protein